MGRLHLQLSANYPGRKPGNRTEVERLFAGIQPEHSIERPAASKKGITAVPWGKTTFAIKRNDIHFFSIVFSSCCKGKQLQKGFVFLPQNGLQLRLEDLFSSPDFAAVLEEKSAEWRQEQGVSSNLPTLQDFYLTQDELVLLFPSPDTLTTLSFSIPLADLSGILSESLLSSLS